MSATNQNRNYQTCEAKNCWRSVGTHSQNEAATSLLSLLPIKAANQSVLHKSDQITVICVLTEPPIVDDLLMLSLRMGRWPYCCLFCLPKLPIHRLCIGATNLLCNYRTNKTTNRWCSIDVHPQNGEVTVLLSLLPIKAASTSVIHKSDQITVYLPDLQNHKSLTLCWLSFSGCVREHVAVVFPSEGCHYLRNRCLQPIGTWIIQDGKLIIMDTASALILRMWQWLRC